MSPRDMYVCVRACMCVCVYCRVWDALWDAPLVSWCGTHCGMPSWSRGMRSWSRHPLVPQDDAAPELVVAVQEARGRASALSNEDQIREYEVLVDRHPLFEHPPLRTAQMWAAQTAFSAQDYDRSAVYWQRAMACAARRTPHGPHLCFFAFMHFLAQYFAEVCPWARGQLAPVGQHHRQQGRR